ncbi:hypothetical protein, partial [Velocimicrobium porci]|uniref:hypothetical protein n=1 Tax=Velocimicrobium porci TaxID=2606634 RepID=UPI00197C0767
PFFKGRSSEILMNLSSVQILIQTNGSLRIFRVVLLFNYQGALSFYTILLNLRFQRVNNI